MISRLLTILVIISFSMAISAQIEGDNIFGQDQVVTIELDFPEADFYSELVNEYNGDQNYITADLTLTDATGTYSMDSVGIRLKGNSSFGHPGQKKSFKIDFNKFISGQNYDGLKKLNFSNGFKDPSVIREKVFFDVSRIAGVPAPRASFANVIFNGEPWGFYTIVEQIDDQFLDWKIEEDDGNLFKAGSNFGGGPGGPGGESAGDLAYYGSDQASYEDRYELKTNENANDWSDLIRFIDFVNNSSDQDFAAHIADSLEFTDFLRSAALNSLFSNLDTYTGSGRNWYIYHNLDTKKWEWIKWDANESFGLYTNMAGNMITLSLDYHNNTRPLLERIFSDEDLYSQYLEEVCDLTENFFNTSYMNNRIDEIKVLVQEHVYADDNKMYSSNDFDTNIESNINGGGGGGGGTTYGLKSFVSERSAYIAGILDCSVSTINEDAELANYITISPNPAIANIKVEWNGAKINSLVIYDISGKQHLVLQANQQASINIDISLLQQGIYLMQISNEGGESTIKKIIKN